MVFSEDRKYVVSLARQAGQLEIHKFTDDNDSGEELVMTFALGELLLDEIGMNTGGGKRQFEASERERFTAMATMFSLLSKIAADCAASAIAVEDDTD